MFLIDDLLLLPIKGLLELFKRIHKMAEEELEDTPEKLKRELLDLQMLFESDEISEEEYQKREDNILVRLNAIKKSAEDKKK